MRYSGIIYNDFSAAPGISLTFFTQGCPFRCKGCHNQETWDFDGGREFSFEKTLPAIEKGLLANGVRRNLCIMGGEPFGSDENISLILTIINDIRTKFRDVKIYVWSGYTLGQLKKKKKKKKKSKSSRKF